MYVHMYANKFKILSLLWKLRKGKKEKNHQKLCKEYTEQVLQATADAINKINICRLCGNSTVHACNLQSVYKINKAINS